MVRRIPVKRKVKRFFIAASLRLKGRRFDFDFPCPRIGVTGSASGYPDLLTRHMLFEGMCQEDVLMALRHYVKPGDVVYDVGGHHGLMAFLAGKAAGPSGKVVTFEPNPNALMYLEQHVAGGKLVNVICVPSEIPSREPSPARSPADGARESAALAVDS